MKKEADGGRHAPLSKNYRPHLTPMGTDEYLAVTVVAVLSGDQVAPGASAEVEFNLDYHPKIDYSSLAKDAKFEIREGSRAVGTGIVERIINEQ